MTNLRRRYVTATAIRWTGSNEQDVIDWMRDKPGTATILNNSLQLADDAGWQCAVDLNEWLVYDEQDKFVQVYDEQTMLQHYEFEQ